MAFRYSSLKPYARPGDLQKVVNQYFDKCEKDNEAPCMSGLGVSVSASVKSLMDWAKMPEYEAIMDEAFLKMEHWLESRLITKDGKTDGIQYALDNRFGWRERREYELGKETRDAVAASLPMKEKLKIIEEANRGMLAMQDKLGALRGLPLIVQPAIAVEEEAEADAKEYAETVG